MKKWLLGLLLGGFLGIFDGLTAPLSRAGNAARAAGHRHRLDDQGVPRRRADRLFSQKVRSLPLGILFGLFIGAALAFGVALMQYLSLGRNYFWQIMLPGAAVGVIVGYVTQAHGRPAAGEPGRPVI